MTALRFLRFAFVVFFLALAVPATANAACINPAGDEAKTIFNTTSKQFQYCDGTNWIAMNSPPPSSAPTGCPVIGNVCSDGSVYAGLSPDGNVPMYTTPADSGQFSWNNGSVSFVNTAMVNCTNGTPGLELSCQTGEANTALLVGLGTTPSPAPYVAARFCSDLAPPTAEALGHDDWYLPAQDELNVMHVSSAAIGGFNVSGSFPAGSYWSSSENGSFGARGQSFSDGTQTSNGKNFGLSVRCVRKVACENPVGVEGQMIYNPDNRVLQGCAGGAWRALGAVKSGALPPDNCDTIGEVCSDGSVYTGLSPDGNEPMYTTPADAGQFTWNDGSVNWFDTAMQNCVSATPGAQASCRTGEANTTLLTGLGTSPSPAPYAAARHCDALSAHGQSDWYLPAQDELQVLHDNRVSIGGFNTTPSGIYWTSSEFDADLAMSSEFFDVDVVEELKVLDLLVRCVRKQPTPVINIPKCSDPVRVEGAVIFNSALKVMQYCDGMNWATIGRPVVDPCDGSPVPGTVCADGSVYAGLSPDGNVKMFTTPADQAGLFSSNDGSTNYVDTAMQNCTTATPGTEASCRTGEANSALLVALGTTPSPAPYVAARNCDTLNAHGKTDWYLPGQDELDVLYDNRVAIGGFNVSGSFPDGWYLSSSEFGSVMVRGQRFSDGLQLNGAKNTAVAVRCVRK